jgi:hypothetical protein
MPASGGLAGFFIWLIGPFRRARETHREQTAARPGCDMVPSVA